MTKRSVNSIPFNVKASDTFYDPAESIEFTWNNEIVRKRGTEGHLAQKSKTLVRLAILRARYSRITVAFPFLFDEPTRVKKKKKKETFLPDTGKRELIWKPQGVPQNGLTMLVRNNRLWYERCSSQFPRMNSIEFGRLTLPGSTGFYEFPRQQLCRAKFRNDDRLFHRDPRNANLPRGWSFFWIFTEDQSVFLYANSYFHRHA